MRICHITSMHDWDDDRIFQRACVRLAALGNNVTLIATRESSGEERGVNLVPLRKRKGLRRRLFSSFEALRIALGRNDEVLHIHDPDLIPWFLFAAFKGRRVVCDVHENFESRFQKLPVPRFIQRAAASAFRGFERFAASRFDGVVTVTESMAEQFRGVASKVAVVGNVPDLERLMGLNLEGEKFCRPTLYTSGSNSDARNCRETVRALPALLEMVPGAQVMFAGRYVPDGYQESLESLAGELGVKGNLVLEGMLPWEENFVRTSRAHVGCVFYEDNANNRVTLPNRLFEYMFCGIPVLGEDFPEVRKVIEEAGCGLVVDSSRPEEIGRAAARLLSDSDLAQEMGGRGRLAVMERYNYAQDVCRLINLYESVELLPGSSCGRC